MKKAISAIQGKGFKVLFSDEAYPALNSFLETKLYSSIFILVDNYTKKHCLPLFLKNFSKLKNASVIKINAGEENKHLKTCQLAWQQLSDLGADRKSLLINLGGGVVSDLGGFVAATFKRGIDFVNVPTTLLSMVDASVGGKTGVDFRGLKNQIGIITHPKMVIIDVQYLKTLPEKEYKSGYAEMLKHGIIRDKEYFKKLSKYKLLTDEYIEDYIYHSVSIKNIIVNEDLYESNLRKILNFGHTLGHAIETHCLNDSKTSSLLHGEAIAIGMIIESYLATQVCGLDLRVAEDIKYVFHRIFPKVSFSNENLSAIIGLLKYDKKNSHSKVKFVLLYALGEPAIDIEVPSETLLEGFDFYKRD
tara:strand:+ start:286 stop:1368 length:1083 start_codon:yes stop_codon:yes gene_type:complete